ncbi:cyclic nucleotide-binding domain-containing protein [Phragmitibacter flavus]|uniref:Cyclic nucleotide-binding domain-containing protein n=1 Tax=Phragmitibacter flavus TaxID=2576071 RepID=A0A5R8KDT9_9BACT|nr:cyclic nucleotide-binding domain-containing protein [Phragmitibacter flavus]TLD70105.1 cyclic nucleotide-binding domain-containing protein [Phragmitibacter flavus]
MKEFAFIHEHGQVPPSLRSLPFLGSFNDDQLDDVLNSSSYINCEEGDVIIEEGTFDSRIYILLSGAVNVCKDNKVLVTIERSGEVFGEIAVVNEDRRSASVVAAKRSVCLAVDQKFLQDFKPRDEDPAFYAALYEFIARVTAARLQSTSRRLTEVELELRALKEQMANSSVATRAIPTVAKPKGKAKPSRKKLTASA